jgi:hypothetical protein
MRPQRGQGWRKGGEYFLKTDFSRAIFLDLFEKPCNVFSRLFPGVVTHLIGPGIARLD